MLGVGSHREVIQHRASRIQSRRMLQVNVGKQFTKGNFVSFQKESQQAIKAFTTFPKASPTYQEAPGSHSAVRALGKADTLTFGVFL